MHIRPFGVEQWMNEYENHCDYNLAETCVASLTIDELLTFAGKSDVLLDELGPMKLTYGAIEGSDRLRGAIAGLYRNQAIDNIVVTHGAIGANALVYQTLVEPGDHAISVLPTYQQHYSIPEALGSEVDILQLRPENRFLPDLEELQQLIRGNTRLVAINNPNNPTGALMDEDFLFRLVDIARAADAWVVCDEVYRGTDQQGGGSTVSIADLYDKGISTGSMSKAFALAGLRLGWIAAPSEHIHAVSLHRDYNTISVGMVDDYLACLALESADAILARSRDMTRRNLAVLADWVENEPRIDWVKPASGTTALLRYDADLSSRDFCVQLLEATGVMLTPGSALDIEGWVRMGYANDTNILRAGLERLSGFLAELP